MNFFERQEQARKSTRRLLWLFGVAVIAIVASIVGAVLIGLWWAAEPQVRDQLGVAGVARLDSTALLLTAVGTVVVILAATLGRIASLRSGGEAVARQLGATLVPEATRDPHLRRLRNVVEEIAIASSVPVPAIFVLEKEAGINAFAAGYSPSDAAVTVTRGALERLNRDELQGVIAHEFSHVLNGDMRLNIRLMGVLFGILVLGIAGRKVLEHSRGARDSKGVAAIMAFALAIMIIGYVGVFFGRLIKAGVSRSREYLADASAVQFTRQTVGIAGALKKIGGLPSGSKLAAGEAEEVSHMLFGDGIGYSSLFATHPPLIERIRALDPQFRPEMLGELARQWGKQAPRGLDEDIALGFSEDGRRDAPLPPRKAELAVDPGEVAAQVGMPVDGDFARAMAIGHAFPPPLRDAAESPTDAMSVVFALLLDGDAAIRTRQLGEIAQRFDQTASADAARQFEALRDLHPMLRLPLAELAFPLLRRRPPTELVNFIDCCDVLIHVDGKTGLFEYCLARLMRRQLVESMNPSRYRAAGNRKLSHCREQLADLFAVIAQHGHDDTASARRAFQAGLERVLPTIKFEYNPPQNWTGALDRAFAPLDAVDPIGKQLLVEGLVAAISQDGKLAVGEAELLRVVCASLHCPLPPMLEGGK